MAGCFKRFKVWQHSLVSVGGAYVPIAVLAGVVLAFGLMRQSFAGEIYVLGDSIGEDIGRVAKQKTLAKVSVSIANHWIYRQLPNVPPSSTVVMSLGTNDADNTGGVGHLGKHIDAIVAAAKAADLKVYWLGPVCVRTASDGRSATLDKILADKLASTSVTYVSMRKPALCDPTLHAHDGQHFRDAGSRLIWQEVSRVAGFDGNRSALVDPAPVDEAAKRSAPVALKPGPAAVAPSILPVAEAPARLEQPTKAAAKSTTSPSGDLVTGSIDRARTPASPAPGTTVPAQISLEVLPLGQPRPAVTRLPPPSVAQPVGRTPQLVETAAAQSTSVESGPVVAKPNVEVLRTTATHTPPEDKPAKPGTCFFGFFSC